MKAVLVIDMQSGCLGCPCYRQTYNDDWEMVRETCEEKLMPLNDTEVANRPKWCPLKPMPEKEIVRGFDRYEEGWNDCIDEILGETE